MLDSDLIFFTKGVLYGRDYAGKQFPVRILQYDFFSGAIMAKFINPFTDVGFKIIFGQEMTKGLLIDFLSDLLVGERHIQDRCVLHEFPSG